MRIEWCKFYMDDDEKKNVMEVLNSGWLSTGPKVKEFEEIMAKYVGAKHAIAVSNGTAALDIALKILNIQPNDEVIIPAMTYIATAHAVCYQGAIPVCADIDPKTFNIDPKDIERKITSKTKCVIPIDYAGQGADYDAIIKIAKKHKLYVVEDGAPGLFGKYKGKALCSMGDIATTSFHTAKIISTIEGGMIFTDNDEYNRLARIIRWQGEDPYRKYYHPRLGFNHRMTDLSAAIGLAQVSKGRVKNVLASRKNGAEYYISKLKGVKNITLPYVSKNCTHSWFLFPILIPHRDEVNDILLKNGIKANISWPMTVYRQESYKKFKRSSYPIAERVTNEILCLPLFYQITKLEQDYVVENLIEAINYCVAQHKKTTK